MDSCSLAHWRRGARAASSLAIGVVLGSLASTAGAHAPPLAARILSPGSPGCCGADEIVVTNRGLVFRNRETGAARLLCNEALRINTAELPNVAVLPDGGLLVASSSGLRRSHDQGCSWSDGADLQTSNTPALAAAPGDANTIFIASYGSDAPGLHVTRDAGATWSLVLATDPDDYVHSLLVTPADTATVYASVTSYAPDSAPVHALLRTRDGGAHWDRRALPLAETDYLAEIAASDPRDRDAIVLYTIASRPGLDPARLIVSQDGGDSFEAVLERPEIRGAGYGGKGDLWVAARDGLYRAPSALSAFERTSVATELGCVAEQAGTLLVCGHYAGLTAATTGVGASADSGQSFERWLDFTNVDAPVECPAESFTHYICARPWLDWQAEMLGGTGGSAPGAEDLALPPATAGGAAPSPPSPQRGNFVSSGSAPSEDPDASGGACALGPRSERRPPASYPAIVAAVLTALWLRWGRGPASGLREPAAPKTDRPVIAG
jgi:hypothetical protein